MGMKRRYSSGKPAGTEKRKRPALSSFVSASSLTDRPSFFASMSRNSRSTRPSIVFLAMSICAAASLFIIRAMSRIDAR
jgi:hypothetical protein